jgi:hypothetical protein
MRIPSILIWTYSLISTCAISPSLAQTKTALSPSAALYARTVRLEHNADESKNGSIVASVTAFPNGAGEEDIYASTDGLSFSLRGRIVASEFATGLCCGTLFELPSQVGHLRPGTLLWAGSVGQNSTTAPMKLEIFASTDRGASWSYLSSCATARGLPKVVGGLWEPEFEIASDGALVCLYSDETQPPHSQLLAQVRSYDGIKWQDGGLTVASNIPADRPGMVIVTRLPGGMYFMSFELCGPAACTVFYKTSPDGWNWDSPTNVGNKIQTASGQYFEHAPTNVWAPTSVSKNGVILLVGQVLYERNGTVSPGNGKFIFSNTSANGSGPWNTIAAPVQVPDAHDNPCPNYSSPLLPSLDGSTVLEFASDFAGSVCQMFYASTPLAITPSLTQR